MRYFLNKSVSTSILASFGFDSHYIKWADGNPVVYFDEATREIYAEVLAERVDTRKYIQELLDAGIVSTRREDNGQV